MLQEVYKGLDIYVVYNFDKSGKVILQGIVRRNFNTTFVVTGETKDECVSLAKHRIDRLI